MIGGLLKSASRLALLAAAGLFVGGVAMPSAKAADLGGDCCADLEERVAELEATTARKGNRKMSLTVTGQVNRMIMFWDDGGNRGTFYGIDNVNSSSRFSFLGSAKISPTLSAGFEIMIEGEGTSGSTRVSALSEDGSFSQTTYMAANSNTGGLNNAGNSDSFFGDARRVAAWIEEKNLGRLTVGRYETAGAVGTIDLGGIGAVTGFGTVALLNTNFGVRGPNGQVLSATWGSFLDPSAYQSRQELLRYDSPTWSGFVVSASVSESSGGLLGGTNWGAMLRYAGEFSGFRVAAGIGFEHSGDVWTNPTQSGNATNSLKLVPEPGSAANAGTNTFVTEKPDVNAWGVALSAMHVPSGVFLQGAYQKVEYNNNLSHTSGYWGETCAAATSAGTPIGNTASAAPIAAANGAVVGPIAPACRPKSDAHWWQIQGGIAKNWFGYGNTVLYGEYSKLYDFGSEKTTGANTDGFGRTYDSSTTTRGNGFSSLFDVRSTTATVWGVGMVQNFDAAATEWYLGYRNYGLDLNAEAFCMAGVSAGNIASSGIATNTITKSCKPEDFHLVTTGLRIKF